MSNFGAHRLRVVNPYEPAFREAHSAVGATQLLARAEQFKSVAEAVADCTLVVGTTAVGNRQILQPLRSLERAGALIRKRLASQRVALLFGSEKWGLSNESLSHCHWLLHIPTREEQRSMNLGQAAAVCLYELARGGWGAPEKNVARNYVVRGAQQPADMATLDRITGTLQEALHRSGYVAPRASATAQAKLRRMLRRFSLGASDAEVFLGMVSKILWRLSEEKKG
jgi:TrmH family RNA methyltransferase